MVKNMNTNLFINPSDQMILNQYQEFINFQNQQQVDTYSQLEKELQTLTDNDVTELSRFEPYIIVNKILLFTPSDIEEFKKYIR